MDVEHSLISKVIRNGLLAEAFTAGVSIRLFHDAEHAEVWEWMSSFWEHYGQCPSRDALRAEFPNYQLVKASEPFEYFLDELRAEHKRAQTVEMVRDAAGAVKDDDVDEAVRIMSDGIMLVAQETAVTKDDEVNSTWEERLAHYETLERGPGGLVGISTGFPTLDKLTGGFQPEQLIYVVGPPKSFKSTALLKMGIEANAAGNKVLFVGFEMSNDEQQARLDGMRAGINYNLILRGQLNESDKQKLRKSMKLFENCPEFTFVHDVTSTTTLSELAAKAHQYKPDLLIVDGLYMMNSEIPGVEAMDTKSLTKISRGLKRLAQTTKVPIIGSTQALEQRYSKKTGLTTASVGYSSAFAQDCDLMLGTEPPDEDNMARFSILAGRNVGRQRLYVRSDWDRGVMEEVEHYEPGEDRDEEDEDE